MAYGYKKLDDVTLAWRDNRDQVKLDLRKMLRRIEDVVMEDLDIQFREAISRGKLLELRPGEETLRAIIRTKALELTTSDVE